MNRHNTPSVFQCHDAHELDGLFNENEMPFNLAGELLDNGITPEGEARVRALAEAEARKAQRSLFECGGTFDGFSCGSDAYSGL